MRILGVDPGTAQTGFGIVDELNGSLTFLDCGVIRTGAQLSIPYRLKRIYQELAAIIDRHRPEVISIENLFVARDVRTALKLGHARGVAILAAVNHDVEVFEYSPAEVKKTVAGSGRADKDQVQKMVSRILSLAALPKPYDASDALAVAICHSYFRHMREKLERV